VRLAETNGVLAAPVFLQHGHAADSMLIVDVNHDEILDALGESRTRWD